MDDEKKVMVEGGTMLHNLMTEYITDQALICPYADDHDMIDGRQVKTCGLIRIPFMDGDVISPEKLATNKHGKEIMARDVLLMQKRYMTFYRREFILNGDNTVTPTYNGHYGDWVDVSDMIENIKHGMAVINKARRAYALQQEKQIKVATPVSNTVTYDMIDVGSADDVVEF